MNMFWDYYVKSDVVFANAFVLWEQIQTADATISSQ